MPSKRLLDLDVFAAVVETGGFSQAARLLGVTTAATSKTVIALERRLGVRLFERSTRRVQPTAAGDALYRRIKPALAELRAAEDGVSSARESLTGRVRLDVPVTFGHFLLPALIAEFRSKHPDIEIVVTSSDRYTDLIAERVDVALRMVALPDSGLIARPLGPTRVLTCASPEYLARRGAPASIEDLAQHDCIAYVSQNDGRAFPWLFMKRRARVELRPVTQISADDSGALRALAAAGAGVIQDLSLSLADDVRAGRLVPVLARFTAPGPPVSLVHQSARHLPSRVRALIDFLAHRIRPAQLDPSYSGVRVAKPATRL
jgi:DNA-binding transcriptional LysR family regulator